MQGAARAWACSMAVLAGPVLGEEPARLELRVRDSRTGASVAARVLSRGAGGEAAEALTLTLTLTDDGSTPRGHALAPGTQHLRVEARGYRPLETRLELDAGQTLPLTLWLDPASPPERVEARSGPGLSRIEGRVFDARTGRALAGARVTVAASAAEAVSDAQGAFALEGRVPPADELALPATGDLVVTARGYRTEVRTRLFLLEGVSRLVVDLEPGAGAVEGGERHKMLRSPDELRRSQEEAPPAGKPREAPAVPPGAVVPVPASIRVGTSCTCATCSAVQVFSLDTYTRLGLDDEWIASWRPDSLRAGAIAYRSYGAYHVAHPRSANFDICNTTCCQVLDPADSHANSDAATAHTTGMMVVNGARTAALFAEYAAENNGSFCPDGQTGRPANNWPCLADGVDAGRPFNGHGRGMCQWGTQRWAANEGRDYLWIVNHYYNDNGNPSGARAGVLQVPDFALGSAPVVEMGPQAAASVKIGVVTQTDFGGTITFSVSGLPFGVDARFDPPAVAGGDGTALILTTDRRVPRGTYPLTVTGTSGALARTATLSLVIVP